MFRERNFDNNNTLYTWDFKDINELGDSKDGGRSYLNSKNEMVFEVGQGGKRAERVAKDKKLKFMPLPGIYAHRMVFRVPRETVLGQRFIIIQFHLPTAPGRSGVANPPFGVGIIKNNKFLLKHRWGGQVNFDKKPPTNHKFQESRDAERGKWSYDTDHELILATKPSMKNDGSGWIAVFIDGVQIYYNNLGNTYNIPAAKINASYTKYGIYSPMNAKYKNAKGKVIVSELEIFHGEDWHKHFGVKFTKSDSKNRPESTRGSEEKIVKEKEKVIEKIEDNLDDKMPDISKKELKLLEEKLRYLEEQSDLAVLGAQDSYERIEDRLIEIENNIEKQVGPLDIGEDEDEKKTQVPEDDPIKRKILYGENFKAVFKVLEYFLLGYGVWKILESFFGNKKSKE